MHRKKFEEQQFWRPKNVSIGRLVEKILIATIRLAELYRVTKVRKV